ncbi:hypothetical protein [Sinorhizobium medicae]|uniref:hypothetical protein n=1 Tax=Sinorhizobium medicae TaxID=110321 RepID=UPI001F248524|nr:hypothetical protein [Sinorhizobium medicae]
MIGEASTMLLSLSSSRSSHRATATLRTSFTSDELSSKQVGTETAGSATGEGPSLRELIDQHSAAVQGGKKATARRLAIINYKPKGEGEANLKLTYLAAYLIATKSTLSAKEMSSLLADRPVRSTS